VRCATSSLLLLLLLLRLPLSLLPKRLLPYGDRRLCMAACRTVPAPSVSFALPLLSPLFPSIRFLPNLYTCQRCLDGPRDKVAACHGSHVLDATTALTALPATFVTTAANVVLCPYLTQVTTTDGESCRIVSAGAASVGIWARCVSTWPCGRTETAGGCDHACHLVSPPIPGLGDLPGPGLA